MTTSPSIWRSLLLTAILGCLGALLAHAQTAPAAPAPATGIGSAPANSTQHHILNTALSPTTRQTLQDAMNAFPEATPASGRTASK